MARLNIEDTFWVDIGRVERGLISYDQLIGNALRLLRFAQEQYKNGNIITETQWKIEGFFDCLIPVFIDRVEGGFMLRGAGEKFSWLRQKVEAGRNGGKKSGKIRSSKINNLDEAAGSGSKRAEPSYSYSSSNNKNINSSSELQWVVDIWNQGRGELSEIRSISEGSERYRVLNARLATLKTKEDWESFVKKISDSDFLSGRNGAWVKEDGTPVCDFDWCIKKKNFEKILSGNFSNKPKESKKETWTDAAAKVAKALREVGSYDTQAPQKFEDLLGKDLYLVARKVPGGMSSLRMMPDNDFRINKIAGMLKESYGALKHKGEIK